MSNYGKKSSAKSNKEFDEVEELLRATEDQMILNLSVDSHASRTSSSSSPLDQDLIRRFEALKAPSTTKKITNMPSGPKVLKKEKKKDGDDGGSEKIVGDDPFARFSALKATGNKSSTSSSAAAAAAVESQLKLDGDRSENEEDEVSKLIQWAIDAARLDPSVSSSEEEEDGDDDLDDDTEDDDADRKKKKKKKPAK